LVDQALNNLEESRGLLTELMADHPENDRYRELRLARGSRILEVLAQRESIDEAAARLMLLQSEWDDNRSGSARADARSQIDYGEFLMIRATIESRDGATEAARASLSEALEVILGVVEDAPDLAFARLQLAMAAYRYWELTGEFPMDRAQAELPRADDFDTYKQSCLDGNIAARLAVMQGDLAAAQGYTAYLLSKGYFEPGFIGFCRSRGLCGQ
jgi:hypothetical protein